MRLERRTGRRPSGRRVSLGHGLLTVALSLVACREDPGPAEPAPSTVLESEASPGALEPWSIERLIPRTSRVPEELFPHVDRLYVHDPDCLLLLRPGGRRRWGWPEHAERVIEVRIDDLGLLECAPTDERSDAPRVLVAGDSHLMVVPCDESFPNRLEEPLRARGFRDCEVLNAGVGYTSPALHLERLRRFLYLAPRVFVLALFTGNDFLDQLHLDYDLARARAGRADLGPEYTERLRRCAESFEGPLAQGLNQIHFFAHWPGTEDLALARTLAVLEETAALCARESIGFCVVLLPTKSDVDQDDLATLEAARATLELAPEDLATNRRLALRLARALAERGIPCVDPLERLRAQAAPCFWRKDYHLSTTGHAAVAEALLEPLAGLLEERAEVPRER